jgi:hypothetical protein
MTMSTRTIPTCKGRVIGPLGASRLVERLLGAMLTPTVWPERSEQQVRETYSLKIRGGKYIPASVDSDLH